MNNALDLLAALALGYALLCFMLDCQERNRQRRLRMRRLRRGLTYSCERYSKRTAL